jgi:hypothetical protein|tara:strand:- start:3501 stop:4229 length:729 start_codon:yes stop_codon:yes gene_type:complete
MDWQNVLKRKIETLADYTNASPDERRRYHVRMGTAYARRLTALRNSIANVGETNPNIPLEEDMKELQEMRNFHVRQADRLRGKSPFPDVFSPELEQQRLKVKLQTTPRGVLNPYTDLSMEEYQRLNNKQKNKYHASRAAKTSGEEKNFHTRMRSRIREGSVLPTFPTSDLGGESTTIRGINYTKEEYDNMSREDKRKYHAMMKFRFRKTDIERRNFHNKMENRIRRNTPLPIFFSPEHEEEE